MEEPQKHSRGQGPGCGASCQFTGLVGSPVPQPWFYQAGFCQRWPWHSASLTAYCPLWIPWGGHIPQSMHAIAENTGQGFLPSPAEMYTDHSKISQESTRSPGLWAHCQLKVMPPSKTLPTWCFVETKGYWKLLLARDECGKLFAASRLSI